jgi:hypothetical protein
MNRKNISSTAKTRRRVKRQPAGGTDALNTAAAAVVVIARAGDERLQCLLNAIADRDAIVISAA